MPSNLVYTEFINKCQETKEDYMIFQGGRRSGKTISILRDIYKDLANKRKQRAIIVTDTYTRLTDSIQEDFKIIEMQGQRALAAKGKQVREISRWNGAPRVDFIFPQNSIKFVYDGKSTLGVTSNVTHIFFNECWRYPESLVRDISYAAGNNCKIYFDYNPYKDFYINNYKTPTNTLITTWKDNAFLPEGAKRNLLRVEANGKDAPVGSYERYLYEVECLGIYSGFQGNIFTSRNLQFVNEFIIGGQPIIFIDPATARSGGDFLAIIFAKVVNGVIYVVDTYSENFGGHIPAAEWIKEKVKAYPTCELYCERNGEINGQFYKLLINNQLDVTPFFAKGDKDERIMAKYDYITQDVQFLQTDANLKFVSQIYEFEDKNGEKVKNIASSGTAHDDNLDCLASLIQVCLNSGYINFKHF